MRHTISLYVFLFALWLLLSGIFEPLLLGLGLLSCVVVVWIARRKDMVDHEGVPIHLNFIRWFGYAFWLIGQIAKANVDVARRILHPKLPISPTVIRVKANMSEMGRVIYANSITLTPGTVSIGVGDKEIQVHALSADGAEDLKQGEMYRRVAKLDNNS